MTGELGQQPTPPYFAKVFFDEVGEALEKAGYAFQDYQIDPQHTFFRYRKHIDDKFRAYITFGVIAHTEKLCRFQVHLLRRRALDGNSAYLEDETSLSRLLWDEFSVRLLAQPDYWWRFTCESDLAQALKQARELLLNYGIPWLEGKKSALQA